MRSARARAHSNMRDGTPPAAGARRWRERSLVKGTARQVCSRRLRHTSWNYDNWARCCELLSMGFGICQLPLYLLRQTHAISLGLGTDLRFCITVLENSVLQFVSAAGGQGDSWSEQVPAVPALPAAALPQPPGPTTQSELPPPPPPTSRLTRSGLVPRGDARSATLAYDGRPMYSAQLQGTARHPETQCTTPRSLSSTAAQLKDNFHESMSALLADLESASVRKHRLAGPQPEPEPEPEPTERPEPEPTEPTEPMRQRTKRRSRLQPSAVNTRSYDMEVEEKLHRAVLRRLAPKRSSQTSHRGATKTTTGIATRMSGPSPTKSDVRRLKKIQGEATVAKASTSSGARDGTEREHGAQTPEESSGKWWLCMAGVAVRAGVELNTSRLGTLPAGSRVRVIGREKSTCGKLRLQIQTDLVPNATADLAVGEVDGGESCSNGQWISELTRSGRFVSANDDVQTRGDSRPRRRSSLKRRGTRASSRP
jgi:hypothetical protein